MAVDASHETGRTPPPRAVLLDALGTLVELDEPVGEPDRRARRARAGRPGRRTSASRCARRSPTTARTTTRRSTSRRSSACATAAPRSSGPRCPPRRATATRRACARRCSPGLRFRAFDEVPGVLRALRAAGRAPGRRQQLGRLAARRAARHGARRAARRGADVGGGADRQARPARSSSAALRSPAAWRREQACTSATTCVADVGGARAAGITPVLVDRDGSARRGVRGVRVGPDTRRAAPGRPLTSRPMSTARPGCPARPPAIPRRRSSARSCPRASSRRRVGPQWKAWTAWVALVGGFAAAIAGALIIGIVAAGVRRVARGPAAGGEHPRDGRPGPVASIGAAILMARIAAPPQPVGLRPAPDALLARRRLDRRAARELLRRHGAVGRAARRRRRRRDAAEGARRGRQHARAGRGRRSSSASSRRSREEFFFRGYFFTALRSWRGMWPAALITGLVFGAIHAGSSDPAFLVPLGLLGMGLCLLYVRTGSLYPCIAAHALNNSIAFGASQRLGLGDRAADRRRARDRSPASC